VSRFVADGRGVREASGVRDVFRAGILGGHRAGQLRGRPGTPAIRCRHATRERGGSQFSETVATSQAAGSLRAALLPTSLWREVAGPAAAASAYPWGLQSMTWGTPLGLKPYIRELWTGRWELHSHKGPWKALPVTEPPSQAKKSATQLTALLEARNALRVTRAKAAVERLPRVSRSRLPRSGKCRRPRHF
jgi:hypothetical protein